MRIRLLLFALVGILCSFHNAYGQINAYAKVTAISSNVLTISNVNETYHTFTVGEKIVIMQMQDNVNGDATNASSFGTIGSIGSAGLYEINTISAKTPTTITLSSALSNTYSTGANASLQVISFQEMGTGVPLDYTTTADITAIPWDGNVGGVIAINVTGEFRVVNTISADGAGFRGGSVSGGANGGACDITTWITGTNDISGAKGEGIFKRTLAGQQYGRAKIINGGGGGNVHNAGGGGGGNYTAGGDGGPGWSCGSSAGGQGGISLSAHINVARIFMGGGGGGGQQNNGVGSAGGNGGGIILIKAATIRNNGTCSAEIISANGITAADTGNDGAGGGGAGGSIIFDVGAYAISAPCAITVSANGGNGGTVNDGATHGAGAGGGQGRVIYSTVPSNNVVTETNNGSSGCNDNTCSSTAGSPSGTDGTGISTGAGSTPLPVSLLYFTGDFNKESSKIDLRWATATELNNQYFSIERSTDGWEWSPVIQVPGNGTSSVVNQYQHRDGKIFEPFYYYRLSQTDLDNTKTVLKVIRVEANGEGKPDVWVYPNPSKRSEKIVLDLVHLPPGTYTITAYSSQGTEVSRKQVDVSKAFDTTELETSNLSPGFYTIRINSARLSLFRKAIIK